MIKVKMFIIDFLSYAHLQSLSNVEEGEIAHFEAMLTPVGDQTMRVEWFYKGEALKASSRVRTVYAFGMVVLEIVGSKVRTLVCSKK